uniref:Secreted protein n=1 Tax=Plectus sambesii TaxID=2011161 RepID=A0A914XRW5_9BILA
MLPFVFICLCFGSLLMIENAESTATNPLSRGDGSVWLKFRGLMSDIRARGISGVESRKRTIGHDGSGLKYDRNCFFSIANCRILLPYS